MRLRIVGAFCASAGMIATTSKLGAMKRADFEAFLEQDLLPRLPVGSILVLDNARIHHGGEIAKIVEKAGCRLLYLPPYSPDFSPIELAWSWIKRFVREWAPRDEAWQARAIAEAIAALPAAHAPGWFRHCGYLQS
jgi:transposase